MVPNAIAEKRSWEGSRSLHHPEPYFRKWPVLITLVITIMSRLRACVQAHLFPLLSPRTVGRRRGSSSGSLAGAHWNFLPKFLSLHYYTTLEGVLGVQRSGQAQGTIICLFGPLFFSQNGMTLKKPTKIINIQ